MCFLLFMAVDFIKHNMTHKIHFKVYVAQHWSDTQANYD